MGGSGGAGATGGRGGTGGGTSDGAAGTGGPARDGATADQGGGPGGMGGMAPLATGGLYVNFMAAEDRGAAAAGPPVYGARAGERLAALKRRYDPENVFRLNHNIAP